MKKEAILKLIKVPDGVEFDLNTLDFTGVEEEWNRQYNGMVKTVGEETKTKTVNDLLALYNLEKVEDIKTLQDATKTSKELNDTKYEELELKFKGIEESLATKDAAILKTNQMASLKKISLADGKQTSIKDDKLEYAYNLINSGVTEDKDFNANVLEFVGKTPEWLDGAGKPSVNLGDTGKGDNPPPGDAKVDDYW